MKTKRDKINDTLAKTFILVHGGNMSTDTWNKLAKSNDYPPGELLGNKIWDSIIPALKARKHLVFAPTLKDEHQSNLTQHIEQITNILTENDLKDVILVGHSYGGMIITGLAAKMPEKINYLVYVDAALPDPGQSLFDILISGGSDPKSVVGLESTPPYVEKLYFNADKIEMLPKTYILGLKSEFVGVTHVAREKIVSNPEKWDYVELPSSHVPMADVPNKLAQLLLKIADNDF